MFGRGDARCGPTSWTARKVVCTQRSAVDSHQRCAAKQSMQRRFAMGNWKDELLKGAMKAMQSPTAQKIMSNEKVQKGFAQAFKASYEIKNELDEKKEDIARKFNLATKDDLRSMKRELDRLRRQVSKLEKERQQAEEDED
jgi:polyhydroxyalkanoate synthesis regulator phasin